MDLAWANPSALMNPSPDEWHKQILRQIVTAERNAVINCSRQTGKTTCMSLAAYLTACFGGFVLVITPSLEQSIEFMARVYEHETRLHLVDHYEDPIKSQLRLVGGGRIKAVPNNERTVRIYSAIDLLVIDEASRVPDAMFGAVSPMLAVSKGRTVMGSTPWGQRGFFYKEWIGQGAKGWIRHRHPWHHCARLSPEFIESERRKHGDLWVDQEYGCKFNSTSSGYFDVTKFEAAMIDDEVEEFLW